MVQQQTCGRATEGILLVWQTVRIINQHPDRHTEEKPTIVVVGCIGRAENALVCTPL